MFNTTLGSDENVTDKMDKDPDPCETAAASVQYTHGVIMLEVMSYAGKPTG